MSIASQSVQPSGSSFESYVALANGLVADLTGICLLDSSLVPRGQYGELTGIPVAKWVRSLDWTESHDVQAAAGMRVGYRWWSAIPLQQSDGTLLGVFCVSQRLAESATQPSRVAADVALRLRPLLDCIHRELSTTVPARARLEVLTGRAAELEWLFNLTANLKGAVDEKRILEQLVAAGDLAAQQRPRRSVCARETPDDQMRARQGRRGAAPRGVDANAGTSHHLGSTTAASDGGEWRRPRRGATLAGARCCACRWSAMGARSAGR